VAHCYSGCGAGEITGVFIAAGLLAWGNTAVAIITFVFAYVFGYAMTLGPMLQEGAPLRQALIDTFYADTLTIAVMEITAITLDLWLSAKASIAEPLFWGSLIVSLTVGLLAAYPVNVLLVYFGVKGGMGNPRDTGGHSHHQHK
jgi:magnesium-transporting ATPase (P-type)